MLYPRNLFFIVGLLALSHSSLSEADDGYSLKDLQQAIAEAIDDPAVKKCNPFTDPGCTLPSPPSPPGCTDCMPRDFSDFFIQDEEFVLPDSIDIGDEELKLFEDAESKQDHSIFSIPAERGL